MEDHNCSRNSVALQLVHEHFEHQRAVVIHTNSKATGDLTRSDNSSKRSNTNKKKVLPISIGDKTHMCVLFPK